MEPKTSYAKLAPSLLASMLNLVYLETNVPVMETIKTITTTANIRTRASFQLNIKEVIMLLIE
jgi:hypothetical protein